MAEVDGEPMGLDEQTEPLYLLGKGRRRIKIDRQCAGLSDVLAKTLDAVQFSVNGSHGQPCPQTASVSRCAGDAATEVPFQEIDDDILALLVEYMEHHRVRRAAV